MNGNSFLVDTNIALYLLSGNKTIAQILDGSSVTISFISELELLGFKGITTKDQQMIKRFLGDCLIFDLNQDIKDLTISIRQKSGLKLPDSIIAATAIYLDVPLLTADKGFKKVNNLSLALFEEG